MRTASGQAGKGEGGDGGPVLYVIVESRTTDRLDRAARQARHRVRGIVGSAHSGLRGSPPDSSVRSFREAGGSERAHNVRSGGLLLGDKTCLPAVSRKQTGLPGAPVVFVSIPPSGPKSGANAFRSGQAPRAWAASPGHHGPEGACFCFFVVFLYSY